MRTKENDIVCIPRYYNEIQIFFTLDDNSQQKIASRVGSLDIELWKDVPFSESTLHDIKIIVLKQGIMAVVYFGNSLDLEGESNFEESLRIFGDESFTGPAAKKRHFFRPF